MSEMELLTYIATAGTWSLAGLLVGYAIGRAERRIDDVVRRIDELSGRGDHPGL